MAMLKSYRAVEVTAGHDGGGLHFAKVFWTTLFKTRRTAHAMKNFVLQYSKQTSKFKDEGFIDAKLDVNEDQKTILRTPSFWN